MKFTLYYQRDGKRCIYATASTRAELVPCLKFLRSRGTWAKIVRV